MTRLTAADVLAPAAAFLAGLVLAVSLGGGDDADGNVAPRSLPTAAERPPARVRAALDLRLAAVPQLPAPLATPAPRPRRAAAPAPAPTRSAPTPAPAPSATPAPAPAPAPPPAAAPAPAPAPAPPPPAPTPAPTFDDAGSGPGFDDGGVSP